MPATEARPDPIRIFVPGDIVEVVKHPFAAGCIGRLVSRNAAMGYVEVVVTAPAMKGSVDHVIGTVEDAIRLIRGATEAEAESDG